MDAKTSELDLSTTLANTDGALSNVLSLDRLELGGLYSGIDFGVGDMTYLSVIDKQGLAKDFWTWQEPNAEEMKAKLTVLGIEPEQVWPPAQEYSTFRSIGRKELLADIKAVAAERLARRRQFKPIRTASARKRKPLRSANYAKEYAMVYLTNYRRINYTLID